MIGMQTVENQWISVDIPPSIEKRMRENIVLCATTSGVCVAWLSRNTLAFLEEPRGMALPFKVTHWMPLPNPPKDKS